MSVIIFFPWLSLQQDYSFGGVYELIRYRIGSSKKLKADPEIDKILRCYKDPRGKARREFVLLKLIGRNINDEFTNEEIFRLFRFREYLAFGALSEVDFFNHIGNYINNSAFRIIPQRFGGSSDAQVIALRTLRKDGATTNVESLEEIQFWCPHHVQGYVASINVSIVEALLDSEKDEKHPLWIPVSRFNKAWMDQDDLGFEFEIEEVCAAMQELLRYNDSRCDPTNSQSFSKAISILLKSVPIQSKKPDNWKREPKNSKLKLQNLRQLWAHDFYKMRSKFSHGYLPNSEEFFWDLREHLLLSAFIFPLLVKQVLYKANLYIPTLGNDVSFYTNSDELRLTSLDYILAQDHRLYDVIDPKKPRKGYTWTSGVEKARDKIFREGIRKAIAESYQQRKEHEL